MSRTSDAIAKAINRAWYERGWYGRTAVLHVLGKLADESADAFALDETFDRAGFMRLCDLPENGNGK